MDPSRADAPISAARLWVAAGLAIVIVGLLLFNGNRRSGGEAGDSGAPPAEPGGGASTPAGGADAATRAPASTAAASSVPAGPPISTAGGSPYTIDIPRIAEAAFGDAIYAVVSGNVVMRGDTPELRLRMRLMNFGRYDVGFWDDSFRLAVGGDMLSPTSGLNTSVPGNSLRYGIVTFRLRPQMRGRHVAHRRPATGDGRNSAESVADRPASGGRAGGNCRFAALRPSRRRWSATRCRCWTPPTSA